ncbi:MAG: hypothetical protein MUC63_09360, partial [Planctomycetes bacterium]|nr:hypothetical protein [Planctomycetota bacterium]
MRCDELTNDLLADLGEVTLDAWTKGLAEAHLASCEACRRRAAELRAILGAARGWGAGPEAPPRVEERLARTLFGSPDGARTPPPVAVPPREAAWARILLPVAVAAMGIVLGYLLGAVPALRRPAPALADTDRAALEARLRDAEARIGEFESSASKLAALAREAVKEASTVRGERDRIAAQRDELAAQARENDEAQKAVGERLEVMAEELAALRESLSKERVRAEEAVALRERSEAQMERLVQNVSGQLDRMEGLQGRVELLEGERRDLEVRLEAAAAEAAGWKARAEGAETARRVRGDADGDGVADVRDAQAILR